MCITGGVKIDFHTENGAARGQDEIRSVRHVCAHHHLFFEGDERTHVFVIESGWVKLYRTLINGERQVVGFCNGGTILGLEGGGDHQNSCEAVTNLTVRHILMDRLAELCESDSRLAGQLLRQMGRQLGAAQAQLATVGAQSADQKLATFLLAFADYAASEDQEFDLPMRRSEIGEFLGLRLETVSRKLSEFQRRKWVRMVSLYRCKILNRTALQALAEGADADEVIPPRFARR